MRYFRYLAPVFLVIAVISAAALFILRGGPRDKKTEGDVKLIRDINSKYYNLMDLKIKSIVFWYESPMIAVSAGHAKDKALSLALNKAKFVVRWQSGNNLTVMAEGVSRQEKAAAGQDLKKILSGMNVKMNELFRIISPAIGTLIERRRGTELSFKDSDNRIVLEISEPARPESVKRIMYFNKDLMLLRTETYRGGKLIIADKTFFEPRDGKYILRKALRSVISDKEVKTEIEVDYADNNGLYTPSLITINSTGGAGEEEKGELSIMSFELVK